METLSRALDLLAEEFQEFPLRPALLYACVTGSTAYNLRLSESSDHDLCVVLQPPPSHVIGVHSWESSERKLGDYDLKLYSLQKYVKLLLRGNPNVLETLWVKRGAYENPQVSYNPDRFPFRACRNCFSSLRAASAMAGYAASQLGRMETGVCEGLGARRRELVEATGYDAKMASHALRILAMGIEFVQNHTLQVSRTLDADYLRRVKQGLIPLSEVKEQGERQFAIFNAARERSNLPDEPATQQVEKLLLQTTLTEWQAYQRHHWSF